MMPGPANVLSCPFCGGKKAVMTLISGNTYGGTVWSDTRRHYPMLPEVSPIQKCPHCGKYYFIEQARSEYADSFDLDCPKPIGLGELSYLELKEAREQMEGLSLSAMQRWILNHQLFMAYNDLFRRHPERVAFPPSEEDTELFRGVIAELLDGIDQSADYQLFHAELLRESSRFDEAREVLTTYNAQDDRWIVDAILRHIDQQDQLPFMLIDRGNQITA